MADYKIYLLDSTGRISLAFDFDGPNEQSAVEEAKRYADGSDVEIWRRTQLVARIEKGKGAAAG